MSFTARFTAAALAAIAALASAPAQAATQGFYRQPAAQGDLLVFLSQGDLWRVNGGGGTAVRLTTHAGAEISPVLLPDGQTLAFVGQLESAGDVYTMPITGGAPQRRTWLGSAQVRVWGADREGNLLVTAPATDGRPVSTGYRLVGKDLQPLPVGDANDLALSLDGRTLYFTRHGLRGDNAKGYRGGALAQIWALDLQGQDEARPLLGADFPRSNAKRPMAYRDRDGQERLAFLSDRDGFFNVWSVKPDGSGAKAHTAWKDFDVRSASISGPQVVVARGADLHRVSLLAEGAQQPPALPIALLSDDTAANTPRWIKRPQDFLTELSLSPTGERVLLGVRGRLATQGTQGLRRAELQQPEGSRCRDAAFSSDGKRVFALCDFSGEVELWQLDALGGPGRQQLTQGGQVVRTGLTPSPDGRYVAHTDLAGALYLTDLKAEGGPKTRELDRAGRGGIGNLAWHPDSQALVYSKSGTIGFRGQLWLHPLQGQPVALTSSRFDSGDAAFSPDGQWLYFASRRHFATQPGSSVWADRNMGPAFEPGEKVFALALQPGLRLPTAAKDELPSPPPKAEAKPDAKADGKADPKADAKAADAKKDAKPALPKIVLEGLAERLFELPIPPGRVSDLAADGKRLWWREADGFAAGALKTLALEPGAVPDTHSERVRRFALTPSGKHLLVQRDAAPGSAPEVLLLDAAPKPPADLAKATVRWSDWQISLTPRQEWQQLFDDAWRLSRDHFYDAQLHGVNWKASRERHAALLPRVGDRAELADLMGQMASDLNLLHSQVGVGDLPAQAEEPPAIAGLGAKLAAHAQGARIERLYRGDPELITDRGPLLAPGLDVRDGDVITAVNGRPMRWPEGVTLLQGEAGKQVRLELLRGTERRSLIVTPVDPRRESDLRYNDWRHARAQAVDKASNGRIGYLHLRAMGPGDVADFAKDFYAQLDKEALVIDVRFNNGGNIDSWILEKLLRRAWAWWQPRHPAGGDTYPNMQNSFSGPLAVLANENTYSDGETFAEGFKRLKLGPVFGKTTSGAGVWLSDRNRLMDNGIVRAAETAQVDANGHILVEGVGVTPDVEVDNPPRDTAKGGDAQLQAAVAALMKQLPASTPAQRTPRVKAYPDLKR
ncbi:S41 family peptidase [Inhella crocodyli]|nr:S41 family peptidase [Inhella crocodyli]